MRKTLMGSLALVLACCGNLPIDDQGLTAARQRWQESGIDAYRLHYRLAGAFIEFEVVVSVRDRVVDSFEVVSGEPASAPLEPLTVPAMFQRIAEAQAEGELSSASFEADHGWPLAYSVDPDPDALDDEFGVTVLGVELVER